MKMLDSKTFQKERQTHLTYLNTVLGGFAFTITLTCLSFKKPEVALYISMPFIAGLAFIGFQLLPASLQLLRKRAKIDPEAQLLAGHIEKTDYGLISFIRDCFPYMYGYGFYVFATLFPKFFQNLLGQ